MKFDFCKYVRRSLQAALLAACMQAGVGAQEANLPQTPAEASESSAGASASASDSASDYFQLSSYFQEGTGGVQPSDFGRPDIQDWGGIFIPSHDPLSTENVLASRSIAEPTNNVSTTGAQGDLAAIISDSPAIQTVHAQQRSQLAFDPRVRGFHLGQVYAQSDGQQWSPVRLDLDSMLSKIDPSLISGIQVLPGPYSSQYGPGFAFIDVLTNEAPRYANGFEAHNRIGFKPMANGGQFYGYDTVYGGSTDYGFIFNYGNRTGSDYLAGNGLKMPASYHSQNFLAQFGVDLSPDTKLEVRYNRLDQTDTEYALQFFDVNFLITDAVSASLITFDPDISAETRLDAWYNRTRFEGDTSRIGKRSNPNVAGLQYPGNPQWSVLPRVEQALTAAALNNANTTFTGRTDGDQISSGARYMKTYGEKGDRQLKLGADVRYQEQHTAELFDLNSANNPADIVTNQPRSTMVDPGLFAEYVFTGDSPFVTTVGGRVDWVSSNAQIAGGWPDGLRNDGLLALNNTAADFPDSDTLYALYLVEDVLITDGWTAQLAFGHAQRPPTLTEKYADGVFVSMIQSGFTKVVGDPNLAQERNYQIDASLKADHDVWHGRATFFRSWIADYVTYSRINVSDPTGASVLVARNTDLATLTGFELYGDVELGYGLSTFGSLQYVRGVDQQLDAPLPGIYPMQGRAGLRLSDMAEVNRWGLELGARMVDRQDRLGFLLVHGTNLSTQVESQTPGFTTVYIKGYYNITDRLNLVAGVENLFDRTYYEHLNLRLPSGNGFAANQVLSPGVSPYLAVEWTY